MIGFVVLLLFVGGGIGLGWCAAYVENKLTQKRRAKRRLERESTSPPPPPPASTPIVTFDVGDVSLLVSLIATMDFSEYELPEEIEFLVVKAKTAKDMGGRVVLNEPKEYPR